ncbi:hypothetical protein PPERSA_00027 [Pseudocohnilembus persalinus]|uniref:Ubiquitin-like domain-containing protein n=1 Tax=Pseudocohnilembus persalinus TaxID=266149 RepID=A0A0V0QUP8_PSEPJ|nr:hypothetical protein PPERSA_00027 [Pseudocohnilembus persalinus]|eukprot:KRX06147.1 hypothetical protein PPERSA_00027 [Pseudocohnilembus persalinus]
MLVIKSEQSNNNDIPQAQQQNQEIFMNQSNINKENKYSQNLPQNHQISQMNPNFERKFIIQSNDDLNIQTSALYPIPRSKQLTKFTNYFTQLTKQQEEKIKNNLQRKQYLEKIQNPKLKHLNELQNLIVKYDPIEKSIEFIKNRSSEHKKKKLSRKDQKLLEKLESDQHMTLQFRIINSERSFSFGANQNETIFSIRQKISQYFEEPLHKIQLFINQNNLDDQQTLLYYKINKNTVIDIMKTKKIFIDPKNGQQINPLVVDAFELITVLQIKKLIQEQQKIDPMNLILKYKNDVLYDYYTIMQTNDMKLDLSFVY